MDIEPIELLVLVDFLMGHSIDKLTETYALRCRSQTEALLRAMLFRGGYEAPTGPP